MSLALVRLLRRPGVFFQGDRSTWLCQRRHLRQPGGGLSKGVGPHGIGAKPLVRDASGPATLGWRALLRPTAFAVAVSGAAIGGAAIWQYENMRNRVLAQQQGSLSYHRKAFGWREDLHEWWRRLPESTKVFVPICAANVLVFLSWRVPALGPTMLRYFAANPSSKSVCWPMLLSTFSHYSFFHLAANMFVLHSFMSPVIQILGKEQFLGLYLSGGVMSSLASHIFKVASGRGGFSMGASGAILALVGVFGTVLPDSQLSIIFLPMLTFSASTAIKGLMLVDTAGLLAGWQFFDHAAHLGGMLFGLWWCYAGNSLLWERRGRLMALWHEYVRKDDN